MGHWDHGTSPNLFELDVPLGFHYREDFITEADERVLLDAIADVAFSDFEMRGVVARRRVAFFGQSVRRSAYLMTGESRQAYEHHIPPVAQLRYSLTFRTLR